MFEYDFTNKDEKFAFTPRNDKFYLDIRYTPILDDKWDINSIILNTYEVTEIYEHQKILKNYKENLSIALEAGSLAAWIFDVKQQMFYKLVGNSFVNDGFSFTYYLDNLHP